MSAKASPAFGRIFRAAGARFGEEFVHPPPTSSATRRPAETIETLSLGFRNPAETHGLHGAGISKRSMHGPHDRPQQDVDRGAGDPERRPATDRLEVGMRKRGGMSVAALALVALLVVAGCILAVARPSGAAETSSGLFGSSERHFANLGHFAKWQAAIRRYRLAEQGCLSRGCEDGGWSLFLRGLRGLDRWSLLVAVNSRINQARYIEDSVNWRTADYWATPFELLRRGGDCEDYAVAKYFALRALGLRADEMRIAVVWDRGLHRFHAVLAVFFDGRPVMLDNQRRTIGSAERPSVYAPLYSVNEEGWWLHQAPGGLPRTVLPAAGTRVGKTASASASGVAASIVRVGDEEPDGERRARRD